jgi:hypothetical protein
MMGENNLEEKWLSNEDTVCREDRITRLKWISGKMPEANYVGYVGGQMAYYLFEEARYSFVYGQFLACIVLGLSFVEQSLAAQFYASGRDDLERANISKLLQEARNNNWISESELVNLERARKIRNPITHFRRPGYEDTIEWRSVEDNSHPYQIIEEDAYHVMETTFHLMDSNVLCWKG